MTEGQCFISTADGYNVPWVHLCMNLIARRHILSGWSNIPVWPCWRSKPGDLGRSLEVIGNWPEIVTCLRHPLFHGPMGRWWLYPALLPGMPCGLCTMCMIGRCRHKGCRSLQGSWLACLHQHIGDMKKSESAAAQQQSGGPCPRLPASQFKQALRFSPTARLVLSQQW